MTKQRRIFLERKSEREGLSEQEEEALRDHYLKVSVYKVFGSVGGLMLFFVGLFMIVVAIGDKKITDWGIPLLSLFAFMGIVVSLVAMLWPNRKVTPRLTPVAKREREQAEAKQQAEIEQEMDEKVWKAVLPVIVFRRMRKGELTSEERWKYIQENMVYILANEEKIAELHRNGFDVAGALEKYMGTADLIAGIYSAAAGFSVSSAQSKVKWTIEALWEDLILARQLREHPQKQPQVTISEAPPKDPIEEAVKNALKEIKLVDLIEKRVTDVEQRKEQIRRNYPPEKAKLIIERFERELHQRGLIRDEEY